MTAILFVALVMMDLPTLLTKF